MRRVLSAEKEGKMKIKYCRKYGKYVSKQHCEFFNEGVGCEFYSPVRWDSLKDLLLDEERPKWELGAIGKPFKCNLVDAEYLAQLSRRRRFARRALGVRM